MIAKHTIRDRIGLLLKGQTGTFAELVLLFSFFFFKIIPVTQVLGVVPIGWLSLRLRKKRWKDLGLKKPSRWLTTILLGIAMGSLWSVVDIYVTEPLLVRLTGVPFNLELFTGIKGNLPAFIGWSLLAVALGGFGEEIAYRGYLLNRASDLMGTQKLQWLMSVIIVSICFGLGHVYQGVTGAIATGIWSALMCLLYLINRRNLWLPILVHAFYDIFGFLLIFLGLHPAL